MLLQMAKYFEKCLVMCPDTFLILILNSVMCSYIAVYLCRIINLNANILILINGAIHCSQDFQPTYF